MVHRIKEEDIHKSSRFLKKNDPKRKGLKLKEISNFLNEGHVSEIISEENFAKKNKKSINVFAHTIIYKNKKSRINNIVISPKTITKLVPVLVSHATLELGSCLKHSSKIESEI